ncbi:MAG: GSCFA domain-containing protein [Alistipes sp.]|nr:GSCFA domain-containing protein [Alistipes sp.]
MKFRTEIDIKPWQHPIDYSDTILSLGSCFATNMSQRLAQNKFRVCAAPTGILFNPASIASSVELMAEGYRITESDLVECHAGYASYLFHSELSSNDKGQAIELMQQAINSGAKALARADHLIITLGTAWVYRLKESGKVVANCHKQPASLFSRELLTVQDIIDALERIICHTSAQLILTISPVRHIGEGLADNSLSKALLRVAVAVFAARHSQRVVYFPSYEILIDDLRDYRFYADDLVHPSQMAIDYIAEKFFEAALSRDAKALKSDVERIVRAANHRPQNPGSEQHKAFCRGQLEAIKAIKGVDLSKESEYFDKMLQINL